MERESILFDFHYTRLYIYSLALSNKSAAVPDISNGRPSGMLSDVLTATRYVGIATDAAREMLAIVSRVYDMDKLRLAPIRWIVRAVHAAVFLVKTVLLTPPTSMYLHKATISIIKKTAITLKDSSPDDVHLANRYSMILLNLCNDMAEKYHSAEALNANRQTTGTKYAHGRSNTMPERPAPSVPSVPSSGNSSKNSSVSIADQRAHVLAVEGLLHPTKPSVESSATPDPDYYGSSTGVVQNAENSGNDHFMLNNKQLLNDPVSFEYSRYNGSATYEQEMTEEGIQLQQQQQQDMDQMPNRSMFLPVDNEGSDGIQNGASSSTIGNNTNIGMGSLEPSYVQYGLGPIAGAAEGSSNSATSFSGTGLSDFIFDFWMEGSEGLGFVDQLVDSVEHQRQKQLLQQQRYQREQQKQPQENQRGMNR